MQNSRDFLCKSCGQTFSRQDHLVRHKLSHGQAKYCCKVPSCGMTFHRQDVLKRHERVHQPDPAKKRRRRRRDIMPASRPATLENLTSREPEISILGDPKNIDLSKASTFVNGANLVTLLQPLEFCHTHYLQTYAQRWSLIHHSNLGQPVLSIERYLAMAALGGSTIPEYHTTSSEFFDFALRSLLRKQSPCWTVGPYESMNLSRFVNFAALESLQTQILLLEYASGKRDVGAQQRTADLVAMHVSEDIPQLIAIANSCRSTLWSDWIYEEQVLRAIWSFYCIIQKVRNNWSFKLSILELMKGVKLPRSDISFIATSEQSWARSLHGLRRSSIDTMDIRLEQALNCIFSGCDDRELLASVSPMGRHIVVVALLDAYYSDTACAKFAHNPTGKARTFIDILHNLKSLWYKPLGELFFDNPPRSLEFQNCLLLNYVHLRAILRLSDDRNEEEKRANICIAASIANEIFAPAISYGAINLNSKAAWFTDAASKRYVVQMARVMVNWATQLRETDLETMVTGETHHMVLYDEITRLLAQKEENCFSNSRSSGLNQFIEDLKSAWSEILRCPPIRWYRYHEWARTPSTAHADDKR